MKKQNSTAICGWETCPKAIREKVNHIVAFFRESLGGDLTGFYLHGSLAQNCFNPKSSDIDFLVVTEKKLTTAQKKNIIAYLQSIDQDGIASPEMSIVTRESLKNLVYPSPFELHYSHSTQDAYTGGQVSWEEQRFDTDLAAHYVSVRERGFCLYGKPIKEIFPEVPKEMFIASLVQDLHWLRQEITRIPFKTVVLNPCRALAYIKEDKFMSKKEGGEWALQNLPPKYTALIEKALAVYSGLDEVIPPTQQGELTEFIDYAIKEFIYLAAKTDAENIFFKRSY